MYPVKKVRVTSPYGQRKSDIWHYGVDLGSMPKGSLGNDVLSIDRGIVCVSKNDPDGYGEYVVIEYERSNKTKYTLLLAHLDVRKVAIGECVKKSQTVGYMGNTPKSRNMGVHTHAEIRDIEYGPEFWKRATINGRKNVPIHCVDPIPYFEEKKDEPSDVHKEAWCWGVAKKIVDGTKPQNLASREQVVQMLYNYNKR